MTTKAILRNILINQIKHVACELYVLSSEIEQFGTMDKAELKLKTLPDMIDTMRKAAWEIQQSRFNKALELTDEINISIGQQNLEEAEVS